MNDWQDDAEDSLPPSKTAIKKEMLALQELGKKIVQLPEGQFSTIPLSGDLEEAITTARRIKSREGLRRQMQYIGKLLRVADVSPIEQAFKELESGRKQAAQRFHELETLRDSLIATGPKAVEEVLVRYPTADGQHLRQLIMQANKESKNNKPPSASKKLFRYLRELEEQSSGDSAN